MWWLLLWPLAGLLGWGWANYMVYRVDGPEVSLDPQRWPGLVRGLLLGPVMIALVCFFFQKYRGQIHFGLRFR